jgi:hypothetical protein
MLPMILCGKTTLLRLRDLIAESFSPHRSIGHIDCTLDIQNTYRDHVTHHNGIAYALFKDQLYSGPKPLL